MFQDPQHILDEYAPIIKRIARSTCYSSAAIDVSDLCQVGEIAALRAIKSYDPACGSNIRSFVTRSIRREIYNEAARFLGVFTVDRRVTALAAKVNKLANEGRSDTEIASILNKPDDYIRDLRLAYNKRASVSGTQADNILSGDVVDEHDVLDLLLSFKFNQIEMTIVLDRILGNKSAKRVAAKLNISRAQIYMTENVIKDRIRNAIGFISI